MLNFAILDERKTLLCYKIANGLTKHTERNDSYSEMMSYSKRNRRF